jgi:TolA-binding protein
MGIQMLVLVASLALAQQAGQEAAPKPLTLEGKPTGQAILELERRNASLAAKVEQISSERAELMSTVSSLQGRLERGFSRDEVTRTGLQDRVRHFEQAIGEIRKALASKPAGSVGEKDDEPLDPVDLGGRFGLPLGAIAVMALNALVSRGKN